MDLSEQLAAERVSVVSTKNSESKARWDASLAKNRKSVAKEPTAAAVAGSQEPGTIMKETYCAGCDMTRPFYSVGEPQEMNGRDVRAYDCMYCATTLNLAEE